MFDQVFFIGAAEVFPGQYLVGGEFGLGGGFDIQAGLFEGLLPDLIVEAFIPEVKFCTIFPCGFDYICQSSVAPAYG